MYIKNNLFDVNKDKPSLTEDKTNYKLKNLLENESIKYLSKIKKINFLISNNYKLKIYYDEYIIKCYSNFIKIFNSIISNYIILNEYNDECDICIISIENKINLNNISINIVISGESNYIFNKNTDIGINSTKIFNNKYDIYFPQLFLSLWERKTNYKSNIYNNNDKKFCIYLYRYDLEYRVKLLKKINKYKKVECPGISCNNIEYDNSRSLYNNITFYDDAVLKFSNYKFVLALENNYKIGYVTEKIIDPIIAGSIPIYAGHHDVFNYINKKRVIYVYDFINENDLIEEIKKIDNDDNLYNTIISEPIFCSDINFDTFEDYIKIELEKSLGLKSRKILISNKNNDKYISNIDLVVKNLNTFNYDICNKEKYIKDFINKKDILLNINYSNISYTNNIPIFYINLKHREDRNENIIKQLDLINYNKNNIFRIDAILHDSPATGCGLSHIKALKMAKEVNCYYSIILEDDFIWENHKIVNNFLYNIYNLDLNNIKWNIICLSYNSKIKKKINNDFSILKNCQTTSGYIIKNSYIPTLLNLWEKTIDFRIKNNVNINDQINHYNTCIDIAWKSLQDNYWLLTTPRLGKQMPSYSDIEHRFTDYKV